MCVPGLVLRNANAIVVSGEGPAMALPLQPNSACIICACLQYVLVILVYAGWLITGTPVMCERTRMSAGAHSCGFGLRGSAARVGQTSGVQAAGGA